MPQRDDLRRRAFGGLDTAAGNLDRADRSQRPAGAPVEDIDVALLRRQDQRGNLAARARIVDQRRLCAEIIIPHILLHRLKVPARLARGHVERDERGRSEEHTSELQSLFPLSYAVYCLKKNTI